MDQNYNLFVCASIYFAPTLIAIARDKGTWGDVGDVFCVNLLIGWIIIGWVPIGGIIATAIGLQDFNQRRINNEQKARAIKARDEFYLREAEKAKSTNQGI